MIAAKRIGIVVALVAFGIFGCAQPKTVAPPTEPEPPIEPEPPTEPEPEPEPPTEPEAVAEEVPPAGFEPIPERRRKGFPGIAFAKVRAFAFDLRVSARPVCGGPLDPDGTPCKTVEQPGVELSPAQTKSLLAMLQRRGTWGSGSACFLPHHGFVFYDAADVPVAEISVCFMCNMLAASPAIPGAKRIGGSYGLSDKGNAALRELCRELGLPKCDAKSPTEFGSRPSSNPSVHPAGAPSP